MTEAEEAALRLLNQQLIGRLAAACEVLGKIANRQKLTCPCCKNEWTIANADSLAYHVNASPNSPNNDLPAVRI